ncbi:MAG: DUF4301 family protein [Bacteroidales bacterium]|nr:DUF4301 family protein [Bacteroidales bacterium]
MFTEVDRLFFSQIGIKEEEILRQIELLQKGEYFYEIVKPAHVGDGILRLSPEEVTFYENYFHEKHRDYKLLKFVPASGAATRMFKELYTAIEDLKQEKPLSSKMLSFFEHFEKFAFCKELKKVMVNPTLDAALKQKNYLVILEHILFEPGLGLGNKPKALIPFHDYGSFTRTAFEEHIFEGLTYVTNDDGQACYHFTVGNEHLKLFEDLLLNLKKDENLVHRINVEFSVQCRSTDTVSIYENGELVRDDHGRVLLRPGGHGALLKNLNSVDADIVFIKNIDNVVPSWRNAEVVLFQKVLAGYLMKLIEDIHANLIMLDEGNVEESDLNEMIRFAQDKLFISFPSWFNQVEYIEKIDYLFNVFNRPVRICGVVKNQGQPGGGPFFCKNDEGLLQLQIVEQSQINLKSQQIRNIFESSTHFNPVNIVGYVRDYKGNKFDLEQFIDPQAGIITEKSYKGKPIKVLELPGLWNGSMADWITVFVEIPDSTFNPVKEVFDLLNPMHLPKDVSLS